MSSPKIAYECIDGHEGVIRIPLAGIKDSEFIKDVLCDTFEACLQQGEINFVVDLEGMELPSSSLIALLIEMTSRVRRLNGDVKIVNLSNTTKSHVGTFSPRNYLSIERSESAALDSFLCETATGKKAVIEKTPDEKSPAQQANSGVLPAADIAEDPIIAKLENRVNEEAVDPAPEIKSTPVQPEVEHRKGERNHLRVKSLAKNLYEICDFVIEYATRANLAHKVIGKMRIAVYEACLNVVEHAYHSNPDNWIDVWIEYNAEMFKIVIQDYGVGFTGFSDKQYDVVSAMDGRQTGGFGLYIIMRSMDQVDYRPDPKHGNRLTMIKNINKSDSDEEEETN